MSVTTSSEFSNKSDGADLQLDANGQLRHLLTLRGLSRAQITDLLDQSGEFLSPPGSPVIRSNALQGRTIANLFFEPSTRTRASFQLAATIDIFVVRDASTGVPAYIADNVSEFVSILNAGESTVAHPTQGLLDLLTIRQHKGSFENLAVAIVGDIAHSRVARSAAEGLLTLGVGDLRLVSPPGLALDSDTLPGARLLHDLDTGIRDADVIMALRIQHERINDIDDIPGMEEYASNFGISHERMKIAAPDAIVMHPGPINRGIEIESSLADSAASVITEQVTNGVAVRMAVLSTVAKTLEAQ
jgi:aspartate carbamoyltransferase catalytic subunit